MTDHEASWWIWARPRGLCSYCGSVALWHTRDRKEYCPRHLFIADLKDAIAADIERQFIHA